MTVHGQISVRLAPNVLIGPCPRLPNVGRQNIARATRRRAGLWRRTFAAAALWLFAGGSIAATQVYLNPCPGGCTFTPGVNNAVTNTTPLVNSPRGIAAFAHNAAAFDAVVACADALLAPFNVTVTLIDPSPAPHIEIVLAGTAANAGFPSGVRGVAPSQCQYIPNAIAFVFANEFAPAQTE